MKKFYVTALLILSAFMLCSCSKEDKKSKDPINVSTNLDTKNVLVGNIPCEFPLVDKETSLSILSTRTGDTEYDDVYVWKKYKEMTGVDVNWTTVKKNDREETVYSTLTNKKKCDLIIRCKIPSNTLTQYGENDLIYNLAKDDMLKKYAPNCWAYLSSHPVALASITNPDGSIYSLPQINSGAELRVSRKLFVNKKWLKKVGLDLPKTTDEFYKMLKAFKENDPNGNGKKDEIPLSSIDWLSLKESFYGSFGLANRGLHNMVVDCDPDTKKVRFIASSDDYKDFLKYFNKLYEENLLDKSIFTITIDEWNNDISNDRIGVFANTNLASVPADKVDDWVTIDEALEGPNGDKLCSAIRAEFHSPGAAVIPKTCSNPELVLRWLDYFWTDEGTLFYHMGIEGETFVADNGSYDYMPSIYKEMKEANESFDATITKYSPYPGGSNPTVEVAPYFKGGEMAAIPANAAKKLIKYGPEEYWPSFTFTSKENSALEACQTDIEKFCYAESIDYITGVKDFSTWKNYKKQLDKLNLSDMLKIYQETYDRYEKNKDKK